MEGHRARPRARPRRHPGRTRRAEPGGPASKEPRNGTGYEDKGRMVGDQLLASIGLLNSHWHENRGVIPRPRASRPCVMAEPDLHAPLGVYDWNAAWITGEIAARNPDPAQPLAVQPIRIPAAKPEDIHLALPRRSRQPVAGHGPSDHHAARRPRGDHGPAPDPRRGHADHAHRRHGPQRRRRP